MSAFDPRLKRKHSKRETGTKVGGLGLAPNSALRWSETIQRIADNPMQFRLVRAETRRAILNQFPYAVYFRVPGNDIVVLAVHGRQHPRRWQSRA